MALLYKKIDETGSGDKTLIAGESGKTITIMFLYVRVTLAMNLTFKNGSTPITGPMPVALNDALLIPYTGVAVLEPPPSGESFKMNMGVGSVGGWLAYFQE